MLGSRLRFDRNIPDGIRSKRHTLLNHALSVGDAHPNLDSDVSTCNVCNRPSLYLLGVGHGDAFGGDEPQIAMQQAVLQPKPVILELERGIRVVLHAIVLL